MIYRLQAPICAALALMSALSSAQDQATTDKLREQYQTLLNSDSSADAKEAIAKLLSERSKYLDVSYTEPRDGDQNSGWKVGYNLDYQYSKGDGFSTASGRAKLKTVQAALTIKGSYAFDDATNNTDLSQVKASFSYIGGDFGAVPNIKPETTTEYQTCLGKLDFPDRARYPDDRDWTKAKQAYATGSEACGTASSIRELTRTDSIPYAYSIGINAGVEGNQNYSETQDTYGVLALISAGGFPSLGIGIDRVDASGNEQRTAITDETDFDRLSVEVGYQYALTIAKDLPLIFSLGYRNYYEIDAPDEIEDADQDQFDYWSASVRVPASMLSFIESDDYSFFVRYTNGQLPFDIKSDGAFELGFSSNIGVLGNLLQ